ncbi:carboxypeptidase-like regulatory domain-containing protein [Agrobacterium tumefaciens]|nr:carboxypeptidase-like regulatory domain-containing protein [Agrobacterium tumefaciens]NTE18554.1 carboxypeptidase-like regulatory domain-containing protein [Agrobacterium tumefaciens]
MKTILITLLLFLSFFCYAQRTKVTSQRNLSKTVTLNVKNERISDILQTIGKAGSFYFSYDGMLFSQDKLVDLNIKGVQVRHVLDQLFNGQVEYIEDANYIILRHARNRLTIQQTLIENNEQEYMVSGFVVDTQTGNRLKQASVYEKQLLQSTLTDENGYFKIRFKGRQTGVILTASKENYHDSTLVFLADVNIQPAKYQDRNSNGNTIFSNAFSSNGIWRFLLSSRQRIQDLNISGFFAQTPFQASLTPGLSSHGSMSANIINKVSLNVMGGYTGGTNGIEIAGLFNLTKGDIKKVQFAGLFNIVGGSVKAIQIAGVYNNVKRNTAGIQVGGILNKADGNACGIQLGGLSNITREKVQGLQVAGMVNKAKAVSGVQLGGLFNKVADRLEGIQFAGLINYARRMDGLQISVLNMADSVSGVGIGLVNLYKNGFQKLNLYSNELVNTNIAYKTGTAKLYSLLIMGKNFSDTTSLLTFGLGFGHEFILNKNINIAAEGSIQSLSPDRFKTADILYRMQALVQVKVLSRVEVFAGPAYKYITALSDVASIHNYRKSFFRRRDDSTNHASASGLGWNFGVSLLL